MEEGVQMMAVQEAYQEEGVVAALLTVGPSLVEAASAAAWPVPE